MGEQGLTPHQGALLAWWEEQRRDLPWRRTRDPWEVLVCEVMAQQTQVGRVAERWRPFVDRYPTPAACAAAPLGEVIAAWSGLGYNHRAVNLHRCATALVERHDGRLPDDLDALLALPGIGPYTARAVLAFAYEREHGVVDTNSARVLARWSAGSLTVRRAQVAADAAVPPGLAWAWNQAMLDLGAEVCRRRRPRCDRCPVRPWCGWSSAGRSAPDPATGSAGVSRGQPAFPGSDREGRGRLVAALLEGPVGRSRLATVMGWPGDRTRADRVAAGVVRDGLAIADGDVLRLP